MTLERFRDWCLETEAMGNHGRGHEVSFVSDVDTRRGICFWGSGRGWQLKRNWREVWARKYPDMPLPPQPEIPKPPRPLSRRVLAQLLNELCSYGEDYEELEYWDQRDAGQGKKPGWRVWSQKRYKNFFLGSNTHEAADTLRKLIEKIKADRNLSGQEPSLGGQADRTGQEPMMGGESGR